MSKNKSMARHLMDDRWGYTMMEVMVVLGLISIVGLTMSTSLFNIKSAQVNIEGKDDFIQFVSVVTEQLKNQGQCQTALAGLPLPAVGQLLNITLPNRWNPTLPGNLPRLGTGPGNTRILSGPAANPKLRLVSLQIRRKPIAGVSNVIRQGANNFTFTRYELEVVITAERANGNGGFSRLAPKSIEVSVYVNASVNANMVAQCLVKLEELDVCSITGTVFDPVSKTCVATQNCQVRGAYTLANCGGYQPCPGAMPNPATGGYGCPSNTVPRLTGQYSSSFEVSCGKKCSFTVNDTVQMWVCMACSM